MPRFTSMRYFCVSLMMGACALLSAYAMAGEADVIQVKVKETHSGVWRFAVTVRHADTGWKHYANNWEVLSLEGERLATRVLAHPHVNEQPFTRSLSGVKIPDNITEVIVRARDSEHEYGGETMRVNLLTGDAVSVQ